MVELTRDSLEVSHHHYPLRNKTCDGKYSQSNREWQIQTTQLPRHVGSLVQRSAHSSPGEEWVIPHPRGRDQKKRGKRWWEGDLNQRQLKVQFNMTLLFLYPCGQPGINCALQCSCLENPRDGRAWWAAVYGVAQSRT